MQDTDLAAARDSTEEGRRLTPGRTSLAAGPQARPHGRGAAGAVVPAIVLLACALAAPGCASKPPPTPTIGVLMLSDDRQPIVDGLLEGMRSLGYTPGRTINYVMKTAGGRIEALPGLVRELAAQRPSMICPLGGPEAQACIPAASGHGIPVVFLGVTLPEDLGIAATKTQPLPRTTGVRAGYADLMPKLMELITYFFPTVKTVTVLYSPGEKFSAESLRLCQQAGPQLGLAVDSLPLDTDEDARRVAESFAEKRYELLLGTPSTVLQRNRKAVVIPAAARAGIRFFGIDRDACTDGAEVAYGPSLYSFGAQGASMVRKVLQGTPPESMPIEPPDTLELSVNLKTAQQIGLTFPPRVLGLADLVIR